MTNLDTKKGPVTIRPTREADAEAYRELRLEGLRTVPTAFGSDVASTTARPLAQWHQQMRDGAGDGDTLSCVAEAAGELVAMTVFVQETGVKTRHQANVYSVYLQPAWRGLGLIDGLVAAGLAWATSRGVRLVKLSVSSTNTPAIRAYTRLGFQVYGIDPEAILWEGRYYNELLMYKRVEDGQDDKMTR